MKVTASLVGHITGRKEQSMKKYKYTCDRGGILVGNMVYRVLIPNGPGDGTWNVIVMEQEERIGEYDDDHFKYVGCLEGEFVLYKEDCLHKPDEFTDSENMLCILNGTYQVFTERGDYSGTMLFVHRKTRHTKKLSGRFVRKPASIDELEKYYENDKYITVPIRPIAYVNLDRNDWISLIHNMNARRDYIAEYSDECGMIDGEMRCIIVSTPSNNRKIAIDAEGLYYPCYAAIVIEEEEQW